VAAWLGGSFGRGEQDAWSDLDLYVVVTDASSVSLCATSYQSGVHTTNERLALFKRFGEPAVIYEDHANAPEGGTFTCILYETVALNVDWILIPRAKARRPQQSLLLFDKVGVPLEPPLFPESLEQRMEEASVQVAFFWTMVPITIKYIIRYDVVFFDLHLPVREVERLVAGEPPQDQPGWGVELYETRNERIGYLLALCERMTQLTAQVAQMGGTVSQPPLPIIDIWLAMVKDPQRRKQYAADREMLLEQVITVLKADRRCMAVWLDGSYARGEQDELSDLDLRVVVADAYSQSLCSVPWKSPSPQTTNERFALLSQFGIPSVTWDTVTFPSLAEDGSFTLAYYETGVHVDWVLIPQAVAQRSQESVLLFDKVGVPFKQVSAPESQEQRLEKASDRIGFFWMVVARSVRYLLRHDIAYYHLLLEQLKNILEQQREVVDSTPWKYTHIALYATRQEQVAALRHLCDEMLELMQKIAQLGGYMLPPPRSTIETLLALAEESDV
jgi:predicted nucleotidyltransferase